MRIEEAADGFEAAVVARPDSPDAWILLGNARFGQGRLEAAAAAYERAIALLPKAFALHNSLGNVLQRQGKLGEAVDAYRRALDCAPETAPERADVLGNLGSALQAHERFEEAIAAYGAAVRLRPDFPVAWYNIGTAQQALGNLDAASSAFVRAISLRDSYALAWNNLGNVCRAKDRFDEAAQCYRRAIALDSGNHLAHYNLGCLLGDLGERAAALAEYAKALALKPGDAQVLFSIGLIELAQGEFEAGWKHYEFRWQSSDHDTPRRTYPHPRWTGGPLDTGKLLLWGEQGLGDEIFFASLVSDAIASGNRVVLDCDRRLVPLFARSFPGVEVVTGCKPGDEVEAHLPLGSLPGLFRRAPADFARARSPYLVADLAMRDEFRGKYADGRRTIGLAWHTRGKKTGKVRSIELGWLRAILALPGNRWLSLQYGDPDHLEQEIASVGAAVEVDRMVDQMKDVDRFAAQVAAMDMVITIDSSTAHVAGALGVPVWVLLPSPADWRWLTDRNDSPWYPSMRLFRQEARGDWVGVLAKVERELG